jgi:hypothetical protein
MRISYLNPEEKNMPSFGMEMNHVSESEALVPDDYDHEHTQVLGVDNGHGFVIYIPVYAGFFVVGTDPIKMCQPPTYYGGGCRNGHDYMQSLVSVRPISGNMIPSIVYDLAHANGYNLSGGAGDVSFMSAPGCIVNGAPFDWPKVFFTFTYPDNDVPYFLSVRGREHVLGAFPRADPDNESDEGFNPYLDNHTDELYTRKRKCTADGLGEQPNPKHHRYLSSVAAAAAGSEPSSEWVSWPFTNSTILSDALDKKKAVVTYASKIVACSTPDNGMFAFIVLSVKDVWEETRYIVLLVLPKKKTRALQMTLSQHYAGATKDADQMLTYIGTHTIKMDIPQETHSCILLPLPAKWVNPAIVWVWIDLFIPLEYNILSNQSSYDKIVLECAVTNENDVSVSKKNIPTPRLYKKSESNGALYSGPDTHL